MKRLSLLAALFVSAAAFVGCSNNSNSDVAAGEVNGSKAACCKDGQGACCKDKAKAEGSMGAVEGKSGCCKDGQKTCPASGASMGAVSEEPKACSKSGCCKNKG